MSRDYRDIVIETLISENFDLNARVTDLEGERDQYRELLQMALGGWHDEQRRVRRQWAQLDLLRDENRRLRRPSRSRQVAA